MKASGVGFDVLNSRDVDARLQDVQVVIYLIFCQGYFSNSSEKLVRSDLCSDAIRLAEVLMPLFMGKSHATGRPTESEFPSSRVSSQSLRHH